MILRNPVEMTTYVYKAGKSVKSQPFARINTGHIYMKIEDDSHGEVGVSYLNDFFVTVLVLANYKLTTGVLTILEQPWVPYDFH